MMIGMKRTKESDIEEISDETMYLSDITEDQDWKNTVFSV